MILARKESLRAIKFKNKLRNLSLSNIFNKGYETHMFEKHKHQ